MSSVSQYSQSIIHSWVHAFETLKFSQLISIAPKTSQSSETDLQESHCSEADVQESRAPEVYIQKSYSSADDV